MSVQTWKRKLSSAEYVFQLYQLNIRLGEILINKPKKYKTNYADEIVRTALSALEDVQIADSIYFTKNSSEQESNAHRPHDQRAVPCSLLCEIHGRQLHDIAYKSRGRDLSCRRQRESG